MQNIEDFNDMQIDLFRRACDDALGPTCATELLTVMEGLICVLDGSGENYKEFGELSEKVEACLAALAFVRATAILERK